MNAVFCLSLMSFNESGLNRLLDHCEAIRERLNENAELKAYTQKTLMLKLTSIPFLKQEVKAIVDDITLRLMGNELDSMN